MQHSDICVIGGGIAGLLCSIWAAQTGKKVRLLAFGKGALTVAGGIIDLYGYDEQGDEIANPSEAILKLQKPHPYALVGQKTVLEAARAFLKLTEDAGYPYVGDALCNLKVPTAIGGFKNSGLIPKCLDGRAFDDASYIIVAGFDLLKDYFPELIANGYRKLYRGEKHVLERKISLAFKQGQGYRDVSALDAARELDKPEQLLNVAGQLKSSIKPGSVVVFPPVLSEKPDYGVWQMLEQELNCKVVETSSMPPSVTGLRLDAMLRSYAEKCGVELVEKAHVIDAMVRDGRCEYVVTQNYGRKLYYSAGEFVLATGGVFGGGLKASMGRMQEPIFKFEVEVPQDQADWSYPYLFAGKPQPFASYGVKVNEQLKPVSLDDEVLIDNLRVIGRQLCGYDFCFEKSGNGVALATAYAAAKLMQEEA